MWPHKLVIFHFGTVAPSNHIRDITSQAHTFSAVNLPQLKRCYHPLKRSTLHNDYRSRVSNPPFRPVAEDMDKSPLNKLPAELRNRIYELALHESVGIHIDIWTGAPAAATRIIAAGTSLALTKVCRQVSAETKTVFLAVNTFVIHTYYVDSLEYLLADGTPDTKDTVSGTVEWLLTSGRLIVQHAGEVTIHLGQLESDWNGWKASYAWDCAIGDMLNREGEILKLRAFRVGLFIYSDEDDYDCEESEAGGYMPSTATFVVGRRLAEASENP